MAMVAGEMVYIEYMGYPGVVHARLLLSLVQDSEWVILTPDLDCYCEDLRPDNPDFSLFFHIPDGSLPPGIPVQQVYSFRPMTAGSILYTCSKGEMSVMQNCCNVDYLFL